MDKQKQAYIYAIIAVLFWSTVASAFKISLRYQQPLQLVFYATIASTIVLFIILILQDKMKLLYACSRRDFLYSAILGFLNPFLYYIVLFKAYYLLSAQEAVTLNYTWPIMLALLSIPLLRQRIGFKSIIAIVVSFIGVFVIAARGDILSFRFTNLHGALLALGSAVIWGLYWIFNIRDNADEILRLFLNFIFGFIYILITILLSAKTDIPEARGLMGAAYVGLFEMGITFAVWLKALKLSRTTAQVGNLIYLAPFLSLLVITLVVKEKILPSTVIGLAFIIAGIVLQKYFSDRNVS